MHSALHRTNPIKLGPSTTDLKPVYIKVICLLWKTNIIWFWVEYVFWWIHLNALFIDNHSFHVSYQVILGTNAYSDYGFTYTWSLKLSLSFLPCTCFYTYFICDMYIVFINVCFVQCIGVWKWILEYLEIECGRYTRPRTDPNQNYVLGVSRSKTNNILSLSAKLMLMNAKTYTQKLSTSTQLFRVLVTTNSWYFSCHAKTGRY